MQNRQVILYVDNEHASTYERSTTEWLLAARARITGALPELSVYRRRAAIPPHPRLRT